MTDQSDGSPRQKPEPTPAPPSSDTSVNTIIDISAHLSHEIVDGAKNQANELVHLPLMVLQFLKNPIAFIKQTPDLKTPTWVTLTIFSGVMGSFVNAAIHQSWLRFFIALFILPTGSFLAVFATTSILKIIFRGGYGLNFRYRSGASIFAFANLFWWIPAGVGDSLPPLSLLGFVIALMIAGVGFVEKLGLPKNHVLKWFSVLAIVHAVLWSLGCWLGE